MAFQTSETKLIGLEGNIVYYLRRYDNKYLARHYPGPPHDPKTLAQIICRDKLTFASTFVSNLGKVGREIQAANGIARQWRKQLVGKVMECFPVELPDLPFPCRLPLIDTPGIKVDYPQMSFVRKGATLTLHVGLQTPPAYRLHRCATAIVVYNATKNLWLSTSDLRTTLNTSHPDQHPNQHPDLTLTLPKSWLTDTLLPAAFILPSFEPLQAQAPTDPYSNKLVDLQQVLWAPLRCIYATASSTYHTQRHTATTSLHPQPILALLSTSLRPRFDSTSHHQHPLFISPFPSCSRAFQRRSRRCRPQPTIPTVPSASPPGLNPILSFLSPSRLLQYHCNIPSFSPSPFPAHLRRTSRPRLPFHRQSPTICPQPPIPVHFSDENVAASPYPPATTLPSASPPDSQNPVPMALTLTMPKRKNDIFGKKKTYLPK